MNTVFVSIVWFQTSKLGYRSSARWCQPPNSPSSKFNSPQTRHPWVSHFCLLNLKKNECQPNQTAVYDEHVEHVWLYLPWISGSSPQTRHPRYWLKYPPSLYPSVWTHHPAIVNESRPKKNRLFLPRQLRNKNLPSQAGPQTRHPWVSHFCLLNLKKNECQPNQTAVYDEHVEHVWLYLPWISGSSPQTRHPRYWLKYPPSLYPSVWTHHPAIVNESRPKKNRLFLPRQLRNKNLPSQANRARSCLCNVTTKGSEIHQIRTKWHPTYCGNPSILSSVPYNLRGYRPTASFSEAFRKYGQDYYKESPPRTAELNLHTTTLTIRLRIYISKHPVNVHSEKKDQT